MNFEIILLVLLGVSACFSHGGSPPNGPRINPCATVRCPGGTRCVLEEVQCFAAPCYPQATCKPTVAPPTCETKVCDRGQVCILQQVQCIRAPCPPVPGCITLNNNEGAYIS